jgi:Flp pilus assembly CpaF family ATPase
VSTPTAVPGLHEVAVDELVVEALRGNVATALSEALTSDPSLSVADQRMLGQDLIEREVARYSAELARSGRRALSPVEERALGSAIADACFGLGRLARVLNDPLVENVDAVGCDGVWVSYADGRVEPGPQLAATDDGLVDLIKTFALYSGGASREFSTAHPLLNLRLADGSRLSAWMSLSERPGLSVRRHRLMNVTLHDLASAEYATVDPGLAAFLTAVTRARMNVLVTGAPNVGKTTLIRAMAASGIPAHEKIVVLEKESELDLARLNRHRQVVALEAREANAEGVGEVTLAELVTHALRMNPDRILVGEVRSDELLAMLAACHCGSKGALSSLHANSAADAVSRMTAIALSARTPVTVDALHALVSGAIDFIVHLSMRVTAGRRERFVAQIVEICGVGEGGRVASNEVYRPGPDGRAVAATPPQRFDELVAAGFDPALFAPSPQLGVVPAFRR